MKKVIWQNGQRVIKQVLDWFQDSGENADKTRRQDYSDEGIFSTLIYTALTGTVTFTNSSSTISGIGTLFTTELKPGDEITDAAGIVTGIVNSITSNTSLTLTAVWAGLTSSTMDSKRIDPQFNIVIGDNNSPPVTHSINVREGIGYDNEGERVVIDLPLSTYNAANPTSTSPDGIGGTVVTPRSTGSINVPLTGNVLNYVWIEYLLVTDTSSFTLQKATGKIQYYKGDDGFKVSVTTSAIPSSSSALLLGTVDLTGGGVVSPSTISLVGRDIAGIKEQRVKVRTAKLDRSDATAVYSPETDIFVDEHIKAVGTGSVTATNPHGIAPVDIGINVEEEVGFHQKFLHSSGIVGDSTSLISSLYLVPTYITPGEDYVTIQPLTVSEVAIVDGVTVTSTDIPNPVVLLFSSSVDLDGTYWVYLNKTTKAIERTNVDPTGDITKLTLWSFYWDADPLGVPMNGNISSIVDLRIFGNIASRELQENLEIRLANGTVSFPAIRFSSDVDSGIYHSATNQISISTGGTERLRIVAPGGNVAILSGGLVIGNSGYQIIAQEGVVGIPGYTFSGNTDTGIYRSASNEVAITCGNSQSFRVTQGGIFVGSSGSVSSPAIKWRDDTNTGFCNDSADVLKIVAGGTLAATATTTNLQANLQLRVVDGQYLGGNATPAIYFQSATTTGIYKLSIAGVGIAANNKIAAEFTDTQTTFSSSNIPTCAIVSSGVMTYGDFHFTGHTGDKITEPSSGNIAISTIGIERLRITSSAIQASYPYYAVNGTLSAPAYSFTSSTNTGMGRGLFSGSSLDFLVGGIQKFTIDTNFYFLGGGYLYKGITQGLETGDYRDASVTTAKLATEAATQVEADQYGSGSFSEPNIARTVVITTTGGPVLLYGAIVWFCNFGGFYRVDHQIYRNGSPITTTVGTAQQTWSTGDYQTITSSAIDFVGAGTYTYTLRWDRSNANMLPDDKILYAIEFKR